MLQAAGTQEISVRLRLVFSSGNTQNDYKLAEIAPHWPVELPKLITNTTQQQRKVDFIHKIEVQFTFTAKPLHSHKAFINSNCCNTTPPSAARQDSCFRKDAQL